MKIVEVKINREIRQYTESIFFGLSIRQFAFSICACGVAVMIYFLLNGKAHQEIVSWACIMGAIPFAALGFITYNGLPAEKIFYCWIKSNILTPKKLVNKPTNYYFELLKPTYQKLEKEGLKSENTKKLV